MIPDILTSIQVATENAPKINELYGLLLSMIFIGFGGLVLNEIINGGPRPPRQ